MSRRMVVFLSIVVIASNQAIAVEKRAMTLDDLFHAQRVADPQISPDGKTVAYVVTKVDLPGNATSSSLWLAATDGQSSPRQLTTANKKDRHPRWSPDGRFILFESNRSGSMQLWSIAVQGGEARQLTTIATDASTGIWSPDGKKIAFVSAVYPEYASKPYAESNELNKKRTEEIAKSPVKAKVFTKLFYRHWDSYVEDKRQHLFVFDFNDGRPGEPKDLTPCDCDAYPTSTTFSIGDDFCFTPDGKFLMFTAAPEKNEAWNTNYDICRVSVSGGSTEWDCLTKDNGAADGTPKFSPGGKKLIYRSQKKPGYEADRWDLMLVDCDASGTPHSKPRNLTGTAKLSVVRGAMKGSDDAAKADPTFDASVEDYCWINDDEIAFTVESNGTILMHSLSLNTPDSITLKYGIGGSSTAVSYANDGKSFTFLHGQLDRPPAVCAFSSEGIRSKSLALLDLSRANEELLARVELPKPESVTVEGAGGVPMQMWVIKPPGFDATKRWPLVFLVHGGPQSAWLDNWSTRWNPEIWAAQGYVVALPNPRGSTGFGQKYVDEISGDWGGKCYDDLMAGLAYLEKQPYIDTSRMASAGASFGGYMMNWFQGNTTKFKTLITHCGVYNFESMYATTEELWFDEWEHGGPPWGPNRASYEKHSPHKKAASFKTPMLIIHNDLDFRVPVSEAHQLFTTLQRLGVPAKFINFPDEGHWVLKPANSAYWHREIFAWLNRYCPPGAKP